MDPGDEALHVAGSIFCDGDLGPLQDLIVVEGAAAEEGLAESVSRRASLLHGSAYVVVSGALRGGQGRPSKAGEAG
jgi:tagatose-1,6-bisphosphate aldolase non-catalytic subunit AgaZ/GatZ